MRPSRERILEAVRRDAPAPQPRPEAFSQAVRFEDPLQAFAENLAEAGGDCLRVGSRRDLSAALRSLKPPEDASRIWCRRVDLGLPADPPMESLQALADLEFAVLSGAPAVAESGAVWVVPESRAERAAAFLAERLVLVVPASSVVHDLHSAYEEIEPSFASFGCFVAGPSKTADIEQALVIGAHGPRALSVLLYAD